MKPVKIMAALLGTVLIAGAGNGYAVEKVDLGKREYDANCAVCHGPKGKGDGPYAGLVDTRIADLTTLSRRNNGVFPFARVYETIDGSQVVKAHGTRDMPIWGTEYRIKAAEYYMDIPYDDVAFVRARILALSEYIYRLQVK
jgi:mono/diheme cytochrome c family protein